MDRISVIEMIRLMISEFFTIVLFIIYKNPPKITLSGGLNSNKMILY